MEAEAREAERLEPQDSPYQRLVMEVASSTGSELFANEVLGPPIERLIELMLVIDGVASGKQETIRTWQDASEPDTEG